MEFVKSIAAPGDGAAPGEVAGGGQHGVRSGGPEGDRGLPRSLRPARWRTGAIDAGSDRSQSRYGQSEVIHGLSLRAEPKKILAVMGRNGTGQDHAVPRADRPSAHARGQHQGRRRRDQRDGELRARRQGRRLRAAGADDLLDADRARRTSRPASSRGRARKIPKRIFELFPVLWDMRKRRGRQPVGRPAAAAGHRARAGQRTAACCCSTSRPKASSRRSSRRSPRAEADQRRETRSPSWSRSR